MSQSSPIMPAQIPSQPKSWLARKWKLLLGLLVAMVVLGIAAVFGIFMLIMSSIKGSDVAKEAMARARSNPAVVQNLGTPIEAGWFASGSINFSGGSGAADLSLPISGPKGKGTLYVTAQKSAGTWTYSLMQAAIEGSGEKIDLLAASPGTPPAAAPPAAPVAQAPSPAPAAPSPGAAPAPTASPTATASLKTGDTNIPDVTADVTECDRKDGVLSIKVRLRNTGSAGKRVGIISNRNYGSYYVTAASKKYFTLKDSEGTYLTPSADMFGRLAVDLDSGGQYTWWAKFPAPPADVKTVTLYSPIAPPLEDIPVSDK